jgi:hypothetical protein
VRAVSLLGTLGIWSLALGGVSGWLVAGSIDRPALLKSIGVRHPPRIRQAHLDWIMMGLILLVIDVAIADIPDVIVGLVAFGPWSTRCCSCRSRATRKRRSIRCTAWSRCCRSSRSAAASWRLPCMPRCEP